MSNELVVAAWMSAGGGMYVCTDEHDEDGRESSAEEIIGLINEGFRFCFFDANATLEMIARDPGFKGLSNNFQFDCLTSLNRISIPHVNSNISSIGKHWFGSEFYQSEALAVNATWVYHLNDYFDDYTEQKSLGKFKDYQETIAKIRSKYAKNNQ